MSCARLLAVCIASACIRMSVYLPVYGCVCVWALICGVAFLFSFPPCLHLLFHRYFHLYPHDVACPQIIGRQSFGHDVSSHHLSSPSTTWERDRNRKKESDRERNKLSTNSCSQTNPSVISTSVYADCSAIYDKKLQKSVQLPSSLLNCSSIGLFNTTQKSSTMLQKLCGQCQRGAAIVRPRRDTILLLTITE